MKTIIIFILIFFIPIGILYADDSNIAYITAKSGLVLRDKPSASGEKIFVLSRNTRVEILEESKNTDRIDNISSKWYRVQYFQIEGWVFGGYIKNFSDISDAYINERNDASLFKDNTCREDFLTKVPYRSRVELIKDVDIFIPLNNSTYYSIKVKWNDFEGWICDTDLSFIEIPEYVPNYNKEKEHFYAKSREDYYFNIENSFGKTKDEIIKKLGKPKQIVKKEQKNRHNLENDYLYTLIYNGLEIIILAVSYDKREFITNFSFTSHSLVKKDKFLNGSVLNVYKEFGIPHKDMNSYVVYYATESNYHQMVFNIKNNKINRIDLISYID